MSKLTPDHVRSRTLDLINEQTSEGYGNGLTLGARNFDSLDVVELAIAIDDEFDITIHDDLWDADTTVAQILSDTVRAVCGGHP